MARLKHTNRKKISANKKKPAIKKAGLVKASALTKSIIKQTAPHARKVKHWYLRRQLWQKIGIWASVFVLFFISSMYGIAQWYIAKHAHEPLTIGATFIPDYARYYDLDPKDTMQAMIDDLGMRRFRLVSYWDDIEAKPGRYNFEELDWQFKKVEDAGGTISLAIGLRQPRWPECHWPDWAKKEPKSQWSQDIKTVMGKVIDRYKDSPALESYQLENEYFLDVFGDCPDHSRDRLVEEYNYVKSKDPNKPLIITRSNNATPSWPVGAPRPDMNGASIYKRVWDRTVTKRYFEYPLPAWYYAFLAGGAELTTGNNTIIHEMQTEAWPPAPMKQTSIEEQDKSLPAEKLGDRIQYGVDTGMRTIDLWGVEWWYWRKMKLGDPSLWNAGKAKIIQLTNSEKQCPVYYAAPSDSRSKSPC